MATGWRDYLAVFTQRRMAAVLVLGFASGLPLALTGQAMQSWLTSDGIDLKTIGLLSLVGMPYTYKFLWAPLMDRYEPPVLGRRKGWLVGTQVALGLLLLAMARVSPAESVSVFALCALGVAFLSASQDIVVDAYRVDVSEEAERGLAAALGVLGYRVAMLVSGGLAFLVADVVGWARTCGLLGGLMLAVSALVAVLAPRLPERAAPADGSHAFAPFAGAVVLTVAAALGAVAAAGAVGLGGWASVLASCAVAVVVARWVASAFFVGWRELVGFVALVAGGTVGAGGATLLLTGVGRLAGWADFGADSGNNWVGLLFVVAQLAAAVPLAFLGARLARFTLLLDPLASYFRREHAWSFLALVVLYKLGDAFAGVLSVSFLQEGLGFSLAEIGVVNKVVGMVATIAGGLAGGLLMVRLRLYGSLLVFGVLQVLSNAGYWLLSVYGKGALGAVHLPLSGDALRVLMMGKTTTGWDGGLDVLLGAAMTVENFASGMGTAALVAFLMALCRRGEASATHYALLSALAAVGRIYVGPSSGYLVAQVGWTHFFEVSMVTGVPGLVLVWALRERVRALDGAATAASQSTTRG